jgi:hypothetical protein
MLLKSITLLLQAGGKKPTKAQKKEHALLTRKMKLAAAQLRLAMGNGAAMNKPIQGAAPVTKKAPTKEEREALMKASATHLSPLSASRSGSTPFPGISAAFP